ncbi:MAG TPA: SulP family inorganic anion transporter [Acidobacteriaceae bacterium]|jgi:MFS superfamily sulfate permease-like transporter|nr:SulP family inorganic anion transporter [Acidobacteriaceae bacterium]
MLEGIRPIRRDGFFRDLRAGIALAALNIPQALGYTRIAGMPVVTGLYTLLLPLAAFSLFGSSRFLVVAADSATAAILAGGLAPLAPFASPHYVALAGWVALLTAAFLLLGRLFRLGFIADFLSQTVLVGFLTGVGFQVGIAVLGESLGLPVASHRTLVQLVEVFRELPTLHLPTLLVSLGVLAIVLGLGRLTPKVPGALVAVVGATAASAFWNFSAHGIAVVGSVAGGLPHPGLALLPWNELPPLILIAGSCAVMVITQSAATARSFAIRHQQDVNENQDLLGLSAANAAAALTGTFVVNGSPTQTAMVETAGGQSQIAQLTTAGVVACVLLFLTGPLRFLPLCVLGALVLLVAIHLIDLRGLLSMRRESPGEFAVALVTAITVVAAGVEQGIVLAMILSLLRIVRHSYRPHTGVVLPDKNKTWKIVPVAPGIVSLPGFVLYRFGAALFYANASRFADEILCLVGTPPSAVRWVVVDAEAITNIDYSASRVIQRLNAHLAGMGIALGFARLPDAARADFDRHRLTQDIGPALLFDRLHDALDAFEAASGNPRSTTLLPQS